MKNKSEIYKEITFDNKSGNKTRELTIKKNKELYDDILLYDKINFLNEEKTFLHKLYDYLFDVKFYPKCEKCDKVINFSNRLTVGYGQYCSRICGQSNSLNKEKRKKTNLERYGVEFYAQTTESKNKQKGNSHLTTNEFKEKAKKTNIEKYGVEHYSQSKEWYNKVKNSSIEKFGVDWVSQSKDVIDKMKLTNLDRYGVEFVSQIKEHREKMKNLFNSKRIDKYNNLNIITQNDKTLTIDSGQVCGHIYEIDIYQLYQRYEKYNYENPCTVCKPINSNSISYHQKEVNSYINSIGFKTINNYRDKMYQIDVFIPEYNIGIEYDGLYWHSEKFYDENYHIEKYEYFKEKNIRIINILEDEWIIKKELVKMMLNNILKINKNIIYARKCKILELNNDDYRSFLIENHIQGYVRSKYKYGLYYNNELISVMSFSKLRKVTGNIDKEFHYELLRFCNKAGYNIIGGGSKLFKHFTNNNKIEKIISYCDLRYFTGEIYGKLGFKFSHKTIPNYYYIKGLKRFHRYIFRKSELVKMGYDKNKTERQIMKELKYLRLYDCGNNVYEFS